MTDEKHWKTETSLTFSIFERHFWLFHLFKHEVHFTLGFPLLAEFVSELNKRTTLTRTSQRSVEHRPFQPSVTDLILSYALKDKE